MNKYGKLTQQSWRMWAIALRLEGDSEEAIVSKLGSEPPAGECSTREEIDSLNAAGQAVTKAVLKSLPQGSRLGNRINTTYSEPLSIQKLCEQSRLIREQGEKGGQYAHCRENLSEIIIQAQDDLHSRGLPYDQLDLYFPSDSSGLPSDILSRSELEEIDPSNTIGPVTLDAYIGNSFGFWSGEAISARLVYFGTKMQIPSENLDEMLFFSKQFWTTWASYWEAENIRANGRKKGAGGSRHIGKEVMREILRAHPNDTQEALFYSIPGPKKPRLVVGDLIAWRTGGSSQSARLNVQIKSDPKSLKSWGLRAFLTWVSKEKP